MSDIFREIEEEVRRERYAQLWKKYSDYVIAAIALVILAAAGFQLWRYYEHKAQLKASQEYTAAQSLLEANRAEQAATAFAKLADSAPGGYAVVARLQNADALKKSPFPDGRQGALDLVRKALYGVTSEPHGTAHGAATPLATVAGKTGTSQVIAQKVPGRKLAEEARDHAWFVGFAPVENPAIAVAVVVEHGGHGGSAAAPVAKKVIEAFMRNQEIMKNAGPETAQ